MDAPHAAGAKIAGASLAWRAILAISLLIGFYLLGLAMAGGLAFLIYADATHGRGIHPKLWIAGILGIIAIGRGMFFWRDPFQVDGLRITRADQPALFDQIQAVAHRMNARMPDEVYLVPDVNAFVTEVGGLLGLGRVRRIMGIGVGLLQICRVDQLRAILAHEFGHFQGGDTRLGGFL